MTKRRADQLERELAQLLEEGSREAGVADAMRLHEAMRPAETVRAAVAATREPVTTNAVSSNLRSHQ